ncbi:drug/metabolite transporter (DMT)-like permease [Chryseobacterium ginsenosidimutans]|nr:drug/metabolite transporter (DMT)-like permease [Chryseobacterium ginsenosidimutans]
MNADKEKWILLAILSIIWGSSFILIKKSLEHFNPYQVGALRVSHCRNYFNADCYFQI